jgi:cytochrome c oxidase subunit II
MSPSKASQIAARVLGAIMLLLAGSAAAFPLWNMPKGVTDISHDIYNLHMQVLWISVAIGVVVFGMMLYSIIMHRQSRGFKAAQFHESTTVEILWTIAPFVILVVMAIPATKTLMAIENTGNADLTIEVTGYQWQWHYDYLNQDISFFSRLSTPETQILNLTEKKNPHYLREVDNELVLSVGKKIRFLYTSNDVIHAWWVPAFGVKRDVIPGFISQDWTRINKPGVYRGQCAELCGRDHAFMPIVVRAVRQAEFEKWVKAHKGSTQASRAPASRAS